MKRRTFVSLAASGLPVWLTACGKRSALTASGQRIVRFGHFPNITHVHGLVAHQLSRQGKGWFESRLGTEIQWYVYNAGPSATEAIFAGALDVTYIGPSPVLNAYAKSKGREMRVLAGAANGGAALVVRPDAGIAKGADFRGKKIATPQLGNTQDVQARVWLTEQGLRVTQTGGDAFVIPTANADQLSLFQNKALDAVWTVEPWVTRLETEAGGRIFLEDRDTSVTMLAARSGFVQESAEITRSLAKAHRELTEWIKKNAAEAKTLVKAELTELMGSEPKDDLINRAWDRIVITDEISRAGLEKMVSGAEKLGFLRDMPNLDGLLAPV
ncbi:MAG: ABC transporter substrate-binding protein [Verrucomicrobiales bacterium]